MTRWAVAAVVVANLAVALWPRPAPPPRGVSADRARAADDHRAPRAPAAAPPRTPPPRLEGDPACQQATAETRAQIAPMRQLLARTWMLSERFPRLAPNPARVPEVAQAVAGVLGRALPAGALECRGPQGQLCNVKGLSHEENMSLQQLGAEAWGLTTLSAIELGGRDGVFVRLRAPGYRPGRPVLEAFIDELRRQGREGACAQRPPGSGSVRITLAIPQDPSEAEDAESVDPQSPAPTQIRVTAAEARVLNAYEQCVLELVAAAAAEHEVPPRTAPATLVGIRFGTALQGRL